MQGGHIEMSRKVVLGITSSAAAYKGVALASMLRRSGFEVEGVLSGPATRLIGPAQLACVTGRAVHTDLFPAQPADPIPHISLSESAALAVVAPATAHFLARMAWGFADDLLTSTILACDCPVVVAPSMNSRMWANPATRENVQKLASRGVRIAGPVSGALACGTSGEGRMMEPGDILSICLGILGTGA